MGIKVIEISNSLGENTNPEVLMKLVEKLSGEFDRVLVEVGAKKESIFSRDYKAWEDSIISVIEAGADGIILEGGMGNVGIYTDSYQVKTLLLLFIFKKISDLGYDKDIIVEAGTDCLQNYIISLFGSQTKIGNIRVNDVNSYNHSYKQEYKYYSANFSYFNLLHKYLNLYSILRLNISVFLSKF
ncbi:MAG: phosphosulfolactate synthase [Candidatus Gracilibacteria bacterium]